MFFEDLSLKSPKELNRIAHILFISLFMTAICFSGLRAQPCVCDNYGTELIFNGDFSLGNTGFTTDYTFNTTAGPGRYGISATPWTANLYWSHCTDHTTGSGNLMWVDCALGASLNIWTQTATNLSLNTDFLISCWVTTVDLNGPSTLQFSINGQPIGNPLTAPATTCNWVEFCFIWNSGNEDSATITITNQSQFAVGNDVGIDDISFRACCHPITNDVFTSICNGDSYQLPGGATVSTAGTYYDTLSNNLGCDSVIVSHLSVLSTSSLLQNISICDGQSYFAGGALQTTSGTYIDTLVNYLGCDSVRTTNLTVLPNSAATINVSICYGQSYFAGGAFQTTSGTYSDILVNYLGCDSLLTTNLIVLPTSSLVQNISICNGQSYLAGGAFQTSGGTYFDTLVNYLGCDSVITTHLTVLPNSSFTVNASICNGQSYFAGGAFQTFSGVYVDSFSNYLGCDSVLTTNLTVLPNTILTKNVSICDGQSYFAGGVFQTASGTYIDTMVNYVGCDSVLITNLTVLPATYFNQTISICQGQSYYTGGAWQTTSGTYFDTLVSYVGCDSVITTTLNVIQPVYGSQNISICLGQSYFAGGNWQTQSGIYNDTLVGFAGCDSILTTDLQVIMPLYHNVSVSICSGQSYYAGGMFQTQAGTYHDTLAAASGCDSIVVTDLSVINPVFSNVNAAICEGQTYFVQGAFQTNPGIYSDTLQSYLGCDSIITTQLTVNQNPVVNLGNDISICEGTTLLLNAGSNFQNYVWQDLSTSSSYSASTSGTFWVRVTDVNDCIGSDTLTILNIFPTPKNFLPADSAVCGKISRQIDVPGFNSYHWNDGSLSSSLTVSSSGIYWVQVQDQNGCFGTDSIIFETVCEESVLMPNAFTPNRDGLNDIFKPVLLDDIIDFEMKIFNRWGKIIFYTKDPDIGWNGEDATTPVPIGEYVWTVQYKNDSGEEKFRKGAVTLLR